ncbi:hypothetical protein SERLA73DRAFT_185568 [Serpula lacrymans var. lacrymans S7.3]|uniref:Phospholipid scramblase n=2 Tax=Serpula lacrymans var. lacrymans TaxID=341189 RepID=F8Q618_SERL3|nr:uncharacterized protein SERLADRAFT_474111 [Serpula lacrymans var. lacrymans S7.9]EGN96056.1 hypothetical protein SERLA73DRAFT_185568 [Serpula lacrymans var. lacrymans S7.3]EGO21579.1 hypothetical protein SERLADRAFT_474111 [Serpula lacrymans var. lacrymans S7.9]
MIGLYYSSAARSILPLAFPRSGVLRRGYALSRFPDRRIGTGRASGRPREHNSREKNPRPDARTVYEKEPSAQNSQLWETSLRQPASNPEEGLRRLLMENHTLTITRQLEMLNIFMGFEQSNRYAITSETGEPLGYIAEEPRGILSMFSRQIFRTHRPFRALVMDTHGSPILWIRRPFAWINSRMFVQRLNDLQGYTSEGEPVLDTFAEVQQQWHLWKRRYDLFLRDIPRRILSTVSEVQPEPEPNSFTQFARVDEGLWAWHFNILDARGAPIATVNRTFRGFGREIFTDTGQYSVNFAAPIGESGSSDPAPRKPTVIRNLTLNERALVLAMAVNIDYDYFSRHSGPGHGMGFPLFWGSGD